MDGCPANTCAVHIPQILVPPSPATDVVSSKILHITYELKVTSRKSFYQQIVVCDTTYHISIVILLNSLFRTIVIYWIDFINETPAMICNCFSVKAVIFSW